MSQTAEDANSEDVVARYKKLLFIARNSLEERQATIAAKDTQIAQLIAALEEEKASKAKRLPIAPKVDDESAHIPRYLLRRIDVETIIWILIEYEGQEDGWKSFHNEHELDEFIQRIPGVPLMKPDRCLTPTESTDIVSL